MAWCVAVLGAASTLVLPGPSGGTPIRTALLVTTAAFFLLQLVRLLVSATADRTRRIPLLLLAVGIALWAAGSATVSASQAVETVTFPAPGEALYLLSYVGIVGFLLLDVPRRRLPAAAVWLEAAVVCGASVCVAGFAVLTPLAGSFDRGGVTLLLAILYPLIDLGLGTLVLAQLLLRQRDRSRRTAALAVGLLGLALADSSFILTLSSDSYSSSIVLDVLWGGSFAVIVGAACSPPADGLTAPSPTERPHPRGRRGRRPRRPRAAPGRDDRLVRHRTRHRDAGLRRRAHGPGVARGARGR